MYIHISKSKVKAMSLPISSIFSRSGVVILATFVIHMGVATAADSTSDIQQQMKEMLAGAPQAYSTPGFGPRDVKATALTADTQELAKQFLLGMTSSGLGSVETTKHSDGSGTSDKAEPQVRAVAYSDMQAPVEQLLLGDQHASD
jgi:hypothetical protein